jgi:hypothetical protein
VEDDAPADRNRSGVTRGSDPEVHPTIAAAFRALDDAGVKWALVRGADDLAAPAGDVDLLVDAGQVQLTDVALMRAGLPRLGVMGHGSHRFYFRWDPPDRRWIKLDVVTEIRFGRFQHLRTPLASGCLDRRRRVGDIWRLDPQDEAWLLLLHLLLDKRLLAPSRRSSLRAAVAQATSTAPVALFLDTRIGPGAGRQVLEVCRRGDDREFAAFAATMSRRWAQRDPVRVASTWLTTLAARSLDTPFPGHPPGLVVRIAGADPARSRTLRTTVRRGFPGPCRSAGRGRRILTAGLHRRMGRLVLLVGTDESSGHPDGAARGVRGRAVPRLLARLAPAPDLVLVVDGTGAGAGPRNSTAPGRGGEGSVPQDARTVALDGAAPVDQLTVDAMTVIWARLGAAAPAGGGGPGPETPGQR